MMMLMITEAAVMPKTGKTHKKPSDSAAPETVSLQLDPKALTYRRPIRLLNNDSISPWTYKWVETLSFNRRASKALLVISFCHFSLHPQHHQWRHSVPPVPVGGSLSAARLSGLRGPGGSEPGVQTHHAPGAAATTHRSTRDGALPLPPGVPPHRGGLHLRPACDPNPAMRASRRRPLLWREIDPGFRDKNEENTELSVCKWENFKM